MKTKIILVLLSLIICLFFATICNAQRQPLLSVTDVPPNEANNRFYNDLTAQINRPALSVVGFDNGSDHAAAIAAFMDDVPANSPPLTTPKNQTL